MNSDRLRRRAPRLPGALVMVALIAVDLPVRASPPEPDPADAPAPSETAAELTEPPADPELDPATPAEPAVEPAPTTEQPLDPVETADPDDPNATAPELFDAGQKAYAMGEYEIAIAKFERAWELSQEPALLFNIGQAYWQWHAVVADVEHLRRARKLFQNYDDLMRSSADYDANEIITILAAIDAQLAAATQAELLLAQLAHQPPPGLDHAALRAEQRRRTTKALTVSGSIVITVGALALATGIAGIIVRSSAGFQLDQAGGRDGLIKRQNPYTSDQSDQLRANFRLGGQLAFAGLLSGGAILPIGITLRVVGGQRAKKERETERLVLAPGGSVLTVEF